MSRKRVAVLISGRGSNMAALIEAAKDQNYPAEIALVLSNRLDAAGLGQARAAGITTEVIDHATFGKDRAAFDRALQTVLENHRIDLVCLAGFMRLLTDGFVNQWQGRMINIHPALLPAFKGLDTHKRAIEAGAKLHGATVHFVVAEIDSGPIIAQRAVAVRGDDSEVTLAARVLAVEHLIYPLALKLVAEGRVTVVDGHCLIDGVPVPDSAITCSRRPRPENFVALQQANVNAGRSRGVIVVRTPPVRAAEPNKGVTPWLDGQEQRTKTDFSGT